MPDANVQLELNLSPAAEAAEPAPREPTRFKPTEGDYYKGTIRTLQVLEEFDRVQVSVIFKAAFGSVSRVFAELHAEGYIEEVVDEVDGKKVPRKKEYSRNLLNRNPDLTGFELNYAHSKHGIVTTKVYRKTKDWPEMITRWRGFLIERERRRTRRQGD